MAKIVMRSSFPFALFTFEKKKMFFFTELYVSRIFFFIRIMMPAPLSSYEIFYKIGNNRQ